MNRCIAKVNEKQSIPAKETNKHDSLMVKYSLEVSEKGTSSKVLYSVSQRA